MQIEVNNTRLLFFITAKNKNSGQKNQKKNCKHPASLKTNVARRFEEHQENRGAGAKYLRGRGPLVLVFQKKLGSRSLALGVESKVKKLSKARKEELIRTNTRIDEIIKQVRS